MDYLRSRTLYTVRGGASDSGVEPTLVDMFDFEKMTQAFEACQAHHVDSREVLPTTTLFISAMQQLCYLFDTLGAAFTFVKSDIESKLVVLKRYQNTQPQFYSNLHAAVEHELIQNSTTAVGFVYEQSPSFSRTLLRLMWALKFTDRLLVSLAKAFDDSMQLSANERTLRHAVATAYDAALAPHHSWTIRKTVKGACLLLPSKEAFMKRIGVNKHDQAQYLHRLGDSMSPLVNRMYAFYDKHQLHALP